MTKLGGSTMDDSTEIRRNKKRGESQYTLKLKSRSVDCQVNGCTNVPPSKAYHQRYKICQVHASMPQMLLNGRHVRFCQHCGRFQPLQEFDGSFKNCRRSLQRHRNSQSRRMRKGSKTPLSSGSKDTSGTTATRPPKKTANNPNSSTTVTEDVDTTSYNTSDNTQSRAVNGHKGPGDIPSFPSPHYSTNNDLIMGAFPENNTTTTGLTAHDIGSLLGNVTGAAYPYNTGAVPMIMSDPVPCQPQHGVGGDAPASAALDFMDGPIDTDWIPDLTATGMADLYQPMAVPQPLPPVPQLPSFALPARATSTAAMMMQGAGAGGSSAAAAAAVRPRGSNFKEQYMGSTLDAALDVLNYEMNRHNSPVNNGPFVVRASLKLFNTTPENLPTSLREALHNILAASNTYMMHNERPGCVHITAEAVLDAKEVEALLASGAAGLLHAALAQGPKLMPAEAMNGPRGIILTQINDQVAALGTTGAVACVTMDPNSPTASVVRAVVPLAMTSQAAKQPLTLLGRSIAGHQDMVVCRRGSATPNLGVLCSGPSTQLVSQDSAAAMLMPSSYTGYGLAAGEYVQFSLLDIEQGLHTVEIQKGSMLSERSASFLIIDNEAAVAELRQLELDDTGVEDVPTFVQAVGVILDHLRLKSAEPNQPNALPAVAEKLAPLAARIMIIAAARRWPALLRLIAPAVPAAAAEAALATLTSAENTGLTLMHIVAGTGCVEVVHVLAEWAQSVGYGWRCMPAGPAAITPLHIAALLDDDAAMATALTELFGTEGQRAWYSARGSDGITPVQVAKMACNDAVLEYLPLGGMYLQSEIITSDEKKSKTVDEDHLKTAAHRRQYPPNTIGLEDLTLSKLSTKSDDDTPDAWPYNSLYAAENAGRSSSLPRNVIKYTAGAVLSIAAAGFAIGVRYICGGVQ